MSELNLKIGGLYRNRTRHNQSVTILGTEMVGGVVVFVGNNQFRYTADGKFAFGNEHDPDQSDPKRDLDLVEEMEREKLALQVGRKYMNLKEEIVTIEKSQKLNDAVAFVGHDNSCYLADGTRLSINEATDPLLNLMYDYTRMQEMFERDEVLELQVGERYFTCGGEVVEISGSHTDAIGLYFIGTNENWYYPDGKLRLAAIELPNESAVYLYDLTAKADHVTDKEDSVLDAEGFGRPSSEPMETLLTPGTEPQIEYAEMALGQFYRNGLGRPILIVDEVDIDSKLYLAGFRFTDHRGMNYSQDGSVLNRWFTPLDLVSQVSPDTITDKEMTKIHRLMDMGFLATDLIESVRSKINRATSFTKRHFVLCASAMGAGAGLATAHYRRP